MRAVARAYSETGMNEEQITPDDPKEDRPGPLQVAEDIDIPATVPRARPGRAESNRPAALTWTLLAAVAVLLVALVWMFVSGQQDRQANKDATLIAQRQADAARREADAAVAQVSRQTETLRKQLQRVQDQLVVRSEQLRASQTRAEELASQVKSSTETLATARGSQSGLAEQLADTKRKLAEAKEDLAAKTEQLAEARAGEAEVAAKLVRVGKDFGKEVSRLREMNDDAIAQLQAARVALGNMVAQRLLAEAAFAQAYLSVAAPGEMGFRACQVATKGRLLDQGKKLRESIGDNAAQQELLDKLEVALTRLTMLDAADGAVVRAFQKMVRDENLSGQVDDVLAGADVSPALRAWLFEVRLVTRGVSRAR